MKTVTTEDIVNEICKVCSKALDGTDIFGIFEGKVREIDDEENGFYPHGEAVLVGDLDFSIEVKAFLSDISYFEDIMVGEDEMGLVFSVENDTIKMYFWNDFQPELSFTFKKTFDDDLFD